MGTGSYSRSQKVGIRLSPNPKAGVNHPRPIFQLFGVCCISVSISIAVFISISMSHLYLYLYLHVYIYIYVPKRCPHQGSGSRSLRVCGKGSAAKLGSRSDPGRSLRRSVELQVSPTWKLLCCCFLGSILQSPTGHKLHTFRYIDIDVDIDKNTDV